MKNKKKLISLIAAFCLVLCLGVFGVLAVTELNLNIGGEIKFSATGVKATISDGRFVTGTDVSNLTDYAGVWQTGADTDKLDGFAVTTSKADYTSELSKWSGLKLQFNEAGDSVYLYFTITNNSTDMSTLAVTITDATASTGVNNVNTSIVLPTIDPIISGETANVFIEFKVNSKLIDAYLKDFALNIKLTRGSENIVVVDSQGAVINSSQSKYTGVKYIIEEEAEYPYAMIDGSEASGDIVIARSVKGPDGKIYTIDETSCIDGNTEITSVELAEGFETNPSFAGCTSLKSVKLPSTLTCIVSFDGCTSLEYIEFPSSLTYIEASAFFGCTSLKSINIPDSVIELCSFAFAGCTSLETVVLPESLTRIGDCAFENCTSLSKITIQATTPPQLFYGDEFKNIAPDAVVIVPKGSLDAYQSADHWKDLNLVEASE